MTRHRLTLTALMCLLVVLPGPSFGQDGQACIECHENDESPLAEHGVHQQVECLDCHVDADDRRHRRGLEPVDCAACHASVAAEHAASSHAPGRGTGDSAVATPQCADCHGAGHAIAGVSAPDSPVQAGRQPATCGKCHGDGHPSAVGVRTVRPVEAYSASAHARANHNGDGGAVCSDCHTAHTPLPAENPASSVHRTNVAETCGDCHRRISRDFGRSIHGRAAAAGVGDSPVCTDCHGEHRILSAGDAGSPIAATNIPIQVCGPCHGNLRLHEKYGLSADQVPSYRDSYHGLAARGGVQRVAHCASCHGVHSILPSSDPASQVHPDNLAETCGKCHPRAGTRFAIGPVHVVAGATSNIVAQWIKAIYVPLIWVVVLGMLAHNALDLVRKTRSSRQYPRTPPPAVRVRERMSIPFRITHGLAAISFLVLVVSGFALKYPESAWATLFKLTENGGEFRGLLHRVAAVGLMGAVGLHVVHLVVSRRARQAIGGMLPRVADLTEFWHRQQYNLGVRAEPPGPVRVGYVEKVEYWAALWGTVITAATGLLLWFENFTLANLPGWVPEAATVLHFYEAVLAALAIAIWHFYSVMFDPVVYPMDSTWLTGKPPYARASERGDVEHSASTDKNENE